MNDIERLARIISDLEGFPIRIATDLMKNPSIKITFNDPKITLDDIKNAAPGESLCDNSVVVFCNYEYALIASPPEKTICHNLHYRSMLLEILGYDYNWYIPNVGELYLAWVMCKHLFRPYDRIWASPLPTMHSEGIVFCCDDGTFLKRNSSLKYYILAFRKVVF